jgi:ABC-2 type transport system ATP-binding protein
VPPREIIAATARLTHGLTETEPYIVQMTEAPPRTLAPNAAEARDVAFSYGERTALAGVSLSIPSQSIFGLLGPNGSGKSTLLSMFAGLLQPDEGSVDVLGEAPSTALRARIGFVFQESTLDPLMTVREALSFHGRLFGLSSHTIRGRSDRLLETVGLADRAGDLTRTLSGGMRRRLELARAFLTAPEVLLLDEPTTGLDPDSEQAVWDYLRAMNREGVTVIAATNKVGEADRYCDGIAFVHAGRIASQGTPGELKAGLRHDGVFAEGDFSEELIAEIGGWAEVGGLRWSGALLHATVDEASTFVPRLFQAAGDRISTVRVHEASLEDAYFDTVGLRIDEAEE